MKVLSSEQSKFLGHCVHCGCSLYRDTVGKIRNHARHGVLCDHELPGKPNEGEVMKRNEEID